MNTHVSNLEERKKVWLALSDLFLDTDVSLSYPHITRVCAESSDNLVTLHTILYGEVIPVCYPTLLGITGEWAGFKENWLVNNIIKYLNQPPTLRIFLIRIHAKNDINVH